jgi:hypothetical protein
VRLRLATCTQKPKADGDEALLVDALRGAGVDASVCAWDSASVDWSEPVPTLIRSTWNYYRQPQRFLAWADRAAGAAPLWNSLETVRWNLDKRYLGALESQGIPVVPTAFLGSAALAETVRARGWLDFVIKPSIGAGSFETRRFSVRDGDGIERAEGHLRGLLTRDEALVQPYLESTEGYGERSLVWIDGSFTHAMRKSPRFAGSMENVTGPYPIADDERRVALAAIALCSPALVYGRVDLARDAAGQPRVMEVELIEPSLFLAHCGEALERLVAALRRLLERR